MRKFDITYLFIFNTKDQYWHADNDCAIYSYFGKKEDSSSIYVKTNYSPTPGEMLLLAIMVIITEKSAE